MDQFRGTTQHNCADRLTVERREADAEDGALHHGAAATAQDDVVRPAPPPVTRLTDPAM